MFVRSFGAAQEVTGSMHLLQTSQGSILIDCGMFQGRRAEANQRNRSLPREVINADVAILTHAHIDHSGSLPTLVKAGFKGDIFCTSATRDVCAYLLRDSARIQQADATYLNKKFANDPSFQRVTPLYDEEEAIEALNRFVGVAYHRPFQPLPGIKAQFIEAGHILGSAQVVLEAASGTKLLFSGDLGRKDMPILRDPELPPPGMDYVWMESTYGDRLHADVQSMHQDLERVITQTTARGGKVIVPSFALGRAQELLYILGALRRNQRIPPVPIFLDSPLAIHLTDVYKLHPECYDIHARTELENNGVLFSFEGLTFTSTTQESMELNRLGKPAVIIAGSGMCESGRVLHHLRNSVEDERNTILIVGFQAQHTLGRRIVEKKPRIRIWGMERDLRAHVEVLNAFSAHADQRDLLAYAKNCGDTVKRFFIVHGEAPAQKALIEALSKRGKSAVAPERGAVEELL